MDIYHGWFNLKDGESDIAFADHFSRYMTHLQDAGKIRGWRLTRRKLGLGPDMLPEFHMMIETDDLAMLDDAFRLVAAREEPVESLHHGVNGRVKDVIFALYRDFPDDVRRRGAETF